MIFIKCKKVPWAWAGHFLYQICCINYSNDAKEADILGSYGLFLNRVKLGGV